MKEILIKILDFDIITESYFGVIILIYKNVLELEEFIKDKKSCQLNSILDLMELGYEHYERKENVDYYICEKSVIGLNSDLFIVCHYYDNQVYHYWLNGQVKTHLYYNEQGFPVIDEFKVNGNQKYRKIECFSEKFNTPYSVMQSFSYNVIYNVSIEVDEKALFLEPVITDIDKDGKEFNIKYRFKGVIYKKEDIEYKFENELGINKSINDLTEDELLLIELYYI